MLNALWLLFFVTALGLLAFPLVAALLPGARLGGWPASRAAAILLLTLISWLGAALPLGRAAFPGALGAIVVAGGLAWAMRWRRLVARLQPLRELLVAEALFVGLFLGLALLQGFIADTTTSDKYQDMAFVTSIALDPRVPPLNPWFAGQPLNYYYLGHWTFAALARASGVDVLTVFVLAAPLGAALAAQLIWYLARAVTPWRPAAALVGVWLLLGAGTPAALATVVQNAISPSVPLLSEATLLGPVLYIRDPEPLPGILISEFPAYTYLCATVHAHSTGVPYLLLGLTLLAWRMGALGGEGRPRAAGRPGLIDWRPLAPPAWYIAFGVVLGAQYTINVFDFPLLAGLLLLIELICLIDSPWRRAPRAWAGLALALGGTMLLSRLALWGFHAHFAPFTGDHPRLAQLTPLPGPLGDLFAWTPVATDLGEFLGVAGFCIGPLALALAALAMRQKAPAWLWLSLLLPLPLALWRPVLALVLPAAMLAGYLMLRETPRLRLALLLAGVVLLLWAGPEIVMVRDIHLLNRSNTVFKWYFQAFILIAVALPPLLDAALGARERMGVRLEVAPGGAARRASAFADAEFARAGGRPAAGPASAVSTAGGRLARAALAVLLAASSLYTVVAAAYLVTNEGSRWWGMGGLATLAAHNPGEAEAIRWLQAQPDTDGVVEIFGKSEYGIAARLRPARVSSYTGRPTLLGWAEQLWVWDNIERRPDLRARFEDLRALSDSVYSGEANGALAACSRPEIGYIYVGTLEHMFAGGADLRMERHGLEQVFSSSGVAIYRCPRLVAAWSPADMLHGAQGEGARAEHWLRGGEVSLRVRSERAGQVLLSFPLASARVGHVTISRAGVRLASLEVGPQFEHVQLTLSLESGLTELTLETDLTPGQLSAQDEREATLLLGLPGVVPVE